MTLESEVDVDAALARCEAQLLATSEAIAIHYVVRAGAAASDLDPRSRLRALVAVHAELARLHTEFVMLVDRATQLGGTEPTANGQLSAT